MEKKRTQTAFSLLSPSIIMDRIWRKNEDKCEWEKEREREKFVIDLISTSH